jgi:uncharacterized protein
MKGDDFWVRAGLLVVALLLAQSRALADPPNLTLQSGGTFSVPVTSMKAIRFRNTVHQQFDFSCGSAALATLLTHHYDYTVGEQDVFKEMYERGDQAKIAKEGFSLLDIKNYLADRGFEADGYVAELEQLQQARVPAIALIQENGYHHFVVVKGLRNRRVLIGDPSAGTRALPYTRFKEMWSNGILFIIRNKQDVAKFNQESDWRTAPSASLGDGLYGHAIDAMLPKRGPSDF